MKKILIATNNLGKMGEIQALMQGLPLELVSLEQMGITFAVAETGKTYAENALLKGHAYQQAGGILTLADDSGIEVDALEGAPGLHSARFSPRPNATDADRRHLLLEKLASIPRPWTARFRAVVAVITPAGEAHLFEGICPGEIYPEERGANGFGYDPVFFLPELGKTMAELEMDQKNLLSHRGRAILAARATLMKLAQE